MAKSMTGYGRSEFDLDGDVYAIEVKSLNHRFLDVSLKTPERFSLFDLKVRDELKARFARGSFTVFVKPVSKGTPELRLNAPLAKLYVDAGAELKKELGVTGDVDVQTLLNLKDMFTFEKKGQPVEQDWGAVSGALREALDQVEEWRVREGAALKDDLFSKLSTVEALLAGIEAKLPEVVEAYRRKLTAEIERLVGGKVDPARILLEAAMFAERTDVNEEIVRLKSHLDLFRKFLKFDEPAGKRLDFLCQEIGREINTIGSKPSDVTITQTVVDMKGEMEKIREQVQNVE